MQSADHIQGNDGIIKKAANSLSCSFLWADIAVSHKTLKNAHILLHHFINTVLLQHVSALKEPPSGTMTDTCPQ